MKTLNPLKGDPVVPSKPVYKTQAEVDAANTEARAFSKRHNLLYANDAYVAQKPGDAVVGYRDLSTGKEYDGRYGQMPKSMIKPLPDWVDKLEWDHNWQMPYYLDGNDMVFVDKAHYNSPRFLKPQPQGLAQGLMALKQ